MDCESGYFTIVLNGSTVRSRRGAVVGSVISSSIVSEYRALVHRKGRICKYWGKKRERNVSC